MFVVAYFNGKIAKRKRKDELIMAFFFSMIFHSHPSDNFLSLSYAFNAPFSIFLSFDLLLLFLRVDGEWQPIVVTFCYHF